MAIPLLDLVAQHKTLRDEVRAAIDSVLDTQVCIGGPKVAECEKAIAAYSGCKHAIGASSGTDAILNALMSLGIKDGDEVITTTFTFFATGGCIARTGAKPVFVDIDPRTFNIDPAAVAKAVTKQTKAIVPVHLFGQMADMDPILAIAKKHNLAVVEDAAQAIGSTYKGKKAGSIGTVGCFSFFPSKNLGGVGDGGMIVTSDDALAEMCTIMRNHGSKPKYYHKFVGGNFRLDPIQAAVILVKLKYLEQWHAARAKNAAYYNEKFAGCAGHRDATCRAAQPHDLQPILPSHCDGQEQGPARRPSRQTHREEDRLRGLLPCAAAPPAVLCRPGVQGRRSPACGAGGQGDHRAADLPGADYGSARRGGDRRVGGGRGLIGSDAGCARDPGACVTQPSGVARTSSPSSV